jgi:hypothetical protein
MGEQVCKTIPNVSEDKVNRLTINLRQVECNTQCLRLTIRPTVKPTVIDCPSQKR